MHRRRLDPQRQDATGQDASDGPPAPQLCAQKDAPTSLLYWFTDLGVAIATLCANAQRVRRPILSLRLLGRLDEELSCANSRFFRKLLYPEPWINRMLRDEFVLHWESVRPVPRVTIDFGDGRRVERTLTGNSVHVVLDARGRAVDAVPGLMSADAFVAQVAQARGFGLANRGELAHPIHSRRPTRRRRGRDTTRRGAGTQAARMLHAGYRSPDSPSW